MKLNRICIIFYGFIYISQLTACPTCVANEPDIKTEQSYQSQE